MTFVYGSDIAADNVMAATKKQECVFPAAAVNAETASADSNLPRFSLTPFSLKRYYWFRMRLLTLRGEE
jgi:hypothetical protein